MSLSESVKDLEDYLTKKSADAAITFGSFGVTAKTGPVGKSTNAIKTNTLTSIMGSLEGNPLAQMGIDTLNQIVTTSVQQFVSESLNKINFSPIENATQNFMQIWATVSTFNTEVAMELARNTGRNIITLIDRKDKIIDQMNAEVIALHNACNLIVNSGRFMSAYIQDLISAYNILLTAQSSFDRVSKTLKDEKSPKFLSNTYNIGISQLESAQKLILPSRDADVSSIRSITTLIESTVQRQTNKQAIAAIQNIPIISGKIAALMLEYVSLTVEINLLLTTFSEALKEWITGFTKNNNIYKVASDHLDAGISQLSDLTGSMKSILLVEAAATPQYDPSSMMFGLNVSSQATLWGIKLQGIIQWMKLNPGVGAAAIDKTASSVRAYSEALVLLSKADNITYTGGTLKITDGQESTDSSFDVILNLLSKVNVITATQTSKTKVINLFRPPEAMLQASKQNNSKIRSAIVPFLNTASSIPGPAAKLMTQALGVANQYGLDRVAGLVSNGKIKELFDLTPQNATYSGAAVLGINNIVNEVKSSPNASDAQISQIEALRDSVVADKTAKEIEANRSYSKNADTAQAKVKEKNKADKAKIQPALEAAKQVDSTSGTSPESEAQNKLASVVPGFNSFTTSLGV